jgi:hypothetical protein
LEKKNGECAACLKYSVLIVVEKKIYKIQHLEGSGTPVLYIGRTVLNPYSANVKNMVMGFNSTFKGLKFKLSCSFLTQKTFVHHCEDQAVNVARRNICSFRDSKRKELRHLRIAAV